MMWDTINPYAIYIKMAVVVSALSLAFAAGWKVESWRWQAAENARTQETIKKMRDLQQLNDAFVEQAMELTKQLMQKQIVIDGLNRKYQNDIAKIPNTTCYGTDAVELWNRAIASVSDAPSISSGAKKGTTRPAGVQDVLRTTGELLHEYAKAREVAKKVDTWATEYDALREKQRAFWE